MNEEINIADRKALLADVFADYKEKGYSYEEIAEVLADVYRAQ